MKARGVSYQFFDHAADVGIDLRAESLEGLFTAAGHALTEWIGPEPDTPQTLNLRLDVKAETCEELLVRWLQELLFLFHQKHAYFAGTNSLNVTGCALSADVEFRIWEDALYRDYQEVKAVTYHQLYVGHEGDCWKARVILDI
ncbi:MAG: archease [Acidobacteria bacterium]|nr:archease [Acidobacteriota bacterium]